MRQQLFRWLPHSLHQGVSKVLAVAGLSIGAIVVLGYPHLRPGTAKQLTHEASPILSSQGGSRTERVEADVITVRPTGFEPKEVTRPAGRVLLVIDNRSGLKELQLRLDMLGGQRIHEVAVSREKLDWRGAVDLQPGTYVLTEANEPTWNCQITVTTK